MNTALMPTYARADLAFERGEGAWLMTADGRNFLDFGGGIATSSLGHAHPHLTRAIAEQAGRVIHTSNLYRIPQAERLAERLTSQSGLDAAFFCNSGAEANEGAVKIMRRAMAMTGREERTRIICFEGAFHGRTLAMLSATGNAKYLAGYGPPVEGFDHVPYGNMNALRDAIGPATAGILAEPVQGEGGVRVPPSGFLRDLRAACDEFGILLGIDEVQSGMGRTGRLFSYHHAGITPDVVTAAKGIAGGFPMGAILARAPLAAHMTPGSHGSTFGGNPLACAAANAVLDVILAPGFLDQVGRTGQYFSAALQGLCRDMPAVFAGVRGQGLLLGLVCAMPNTALSDACLSEHLLTVTAGENVLRLAPPLTVTEAECDDAVARLRRAGLRVMAAAQGNEAA